MKPLSSHETSSTLRYLEKQFLGKPSFFAETQTRMVISFLFTILRQIESAFAAPALF